MFDPLDWQPIVISLFFLLAGLGIVWVTERLHKRVEGAAIAGLLLVPFIAYLLYSGQLESFKGGGLEFKLRQAAAQPVLSARVQNEIRSAELARITASAEELRAEALLGQPVQIILLNATEWSDLSPSELVHPALRVETVIYSSLLAGDFMELIVVDEDSRPLGVFEHTYFLDVLRIPFFLYLVRNEDREYAATEFQIKAFIGDCDVRWTS